MSFLSINGYPIFTIFWNIFLLFIPFFLALYLEKNFKNSGFKKFFQKIIAIIVGFLWLLFIPNTAYIITDVRHLLNYCPMSFYRVCPENAWMIMFFFVYAYIGWVAFVILLNQMRRLVGAIWNKTAGTIYIFIIIPFISIGALIGLIDRWNSWEFLICPLGIFRSIIIYFSDIIYFRNWLIFTIGLYILYFSGDFLLRSRFSSRGKF